MTNVRLTILNEAAELRFFYVVVDAYTLEELKIWTSEIHVPDTASAMRPTSRTSSACRGAGARRPRRPRQCHLAVPDLELPAVLESPIHAGDGEAIDVEAPPRCVAATGKCRGSVDAGGGRGGCVADLRWRSRCGAAATARRTTAVEVEADAARGKLGKSLFK